MKDTIRDVVETIKEDLPMEIALKIDGEVKEVDVIEIDETNVKYILDGEMEVMKFKDFRSDLIRYNRFLVDYITKQNDNK